MYAYIPLLEARSLISGYIIAHCTVFSAPTTWLKDSFGVLLLSESCTVFHASKAWLKCPDLGVRILSDSRTVFHA